MNPPRILVCAGLEPSGRAGLLADLQTISAMGAKAAAVVTALTAQGKKFLCMPVAPRVLREQLLGVGEVDAVKLGMVPNAATLRTLLGVIRGWPVPVVWDPVVRTSRGEKLSTLTPRDFLEAGFSRCVLTPNLEEMAWLGVTPEALLDAGFGAVIVKGGETARDLVFAPTRTALTGTRLQRSLTHHRGTGCRFASALAVELSQGAPVELAARAAKRHVRKFLRAL